METFIEYVLFYPTFSCPLQLSYIVLYSILFYTILCCCIFVLSRFIFSSLVFFCFVLDSVVSRSIQYNTIPFCSTLFHLDLLTIIKQTVWVFFNQLSVTWDTGGPYHFFHQIAAKLKDDKDSYLGHHNSTRTTLQYSILQYVA